jgi:hypothetical protein
MGALREGHLGLGLIDRIRRSHAIEHATVAVLLKRGTRPPLGGYGTPGGFFIYGKLSTEDVASAADEALRRMQGGERDLAVSPFCGTNLLVGALLMALAVRIAGRVSKERSGRRVPLVALGVLGSLWLRRPAGAVVQRHFTTLSDVDDVEIIETKRYELAGQILHLVRTRDGSA